MISLPRVNALSVVTSTSSSGGDDNILLLSHQCNIEVPLSDKPDTRELVEATAARMRATGGRREETQDVSFHTGEPSDWYLRTGGEGKEGRD